MKTFNKNSMQLRVVVLDGKPWFCLADVCAVHDLRHVIPDRFGMSEADRMLLLLGIWFVDELYFCQVLFRKREKEEVKQYQAWVIDEVMPQVRQMV